MNEHKFCFIICTNNDMFFEESLHYINHLAIPEGYSIDLLSVKEADSMTCGYNEAMSASDAKYKIYMHQDVFILNKNLLNDLLSIFKADQKIGMIGMVGYDTISTDGIMWHENRYGCLYEHHPSFSYTPLSEYSYSLQADGYGQAALIDGFLMATAYDLPWDDTVLTGWDFYDAFQSIHFLLHGYKIVVPEQRHPWCLHDDNKLLNLTQYDLFRRKFMATYHDYLGKHYSQIPILFSGRDEA